MAIITKYLHLPVNGMLRDICLIMKNYIFLFGDIHWLQIKVTAMVTPSAPAYATVSYSVFGFFLLKRFVNNLLLYRRFKDNVPVLWKKFNETLDAAELRAFQETMQEWYGLEWTFQGSFQNL